jgi:hypothetical protein
MSLRPTVWVRRRRCWATPEKAGLVGGEQSDGASRINEEARYRKLYDGSDFWGSMREDSGKHDVLSGIEGSL